MNVRIGKRICWRLNFLRMFKSYLQKLQVKKNLTDSEMRTAMEELLTGFVPKPDIISFLTLLRDKGETMDEIKGAVMALRQKMAPFFCQSQDVLDTCGTGGDQKNTFNISTAAAFIIAGAGIPVAKHGNRAVSSICGSADLLKACGVNVEAPSDLVKKCVDEIGIGFLFAPLYHQAMKTVADARQKLATKTIFNILGPLLNPAGAKKQVIGVYHERLLPIVAQVLSDLGSTHVAVMHGKDGMDEITLTTTTKICFLRNGKITEEIFDPRSVGYDTCSPEDLKGSMPEENAKRLRKMLKGHSQPVDHCVHLNAALGILVAGKTHEFKEALLMAQESIASGRAYQKLEALVEMTHGIHSS